MIKCCHLLLFVLYLVKLLIIRHYNNVIIVNLLCLLRLWVPFLRLFIWVFLLIVIVKTIIHVVVVFELCVLFFSSCSWVLGLFNCCFFNICFRTKIRVIVTNSVFTIIICIIILLVFRLRIIIWRPSLIVTLLWSVGRSWPIIYNLWPLINIWFSSFVTSTRWISNSLHFCSPNNFWVNFNQRITTFICIFLTL